MNLRDSMFSPFLSDLLCSIFWFSSFFPCFFRRCKWESGLGPDLGKSTFIVGFISVADKNKQRRSPGVHRWPCGGLPFWGLEPREDQKTELLTLIQWAERWGVWAQSNPQQSVLPKDAKGMGIGCQIQKTATKHHKQIWISS